MTGSHALTVRAGITYRQLDHWTRTGLVTAANGETHQGLPRTYDEAEARVVCWMARLVDTGIAPRTAARVARDLDASGGTAGLGDFTLTYRGAS